MNVEQARKLADSAIERLAVALEQGQSETLKGYLAAMGRFHRYSLNNVILIALARPGATQVAGFHTWKRLGRHVRKGEKGIAILAPLVRRGTERRRNRLLVREGEVSGRAESGWEEVLGFRTAYVFDVGQTEGKPLPEFASVSGDPGSCTARLKAFIARRGITLEYSDRIAPAQGASSGGHITLLPGLSPAEELSVLAHEVAHEMLHGVEERGRLSKAARETEAEAVAYAVCQSVGLDASSASSDYVQLWDGDKKTLAASLERIRRTAVEIIQAVTVCPEGRAGFRSKEEPATAGAAGRVKGVSPHGFSAAA